MIVNPIKTHRITTADTDITFVLDKYLPEIKEGSILAVTSKIASICEGRVVKIGQVPKDDLIKRESQYFIPRDQNPYRVSLTITRNNLVATAGIDESNGNGYYILWPKDPQESANKIRGHLVAKFKLKNVGVIITDSRTTPLRWGVTAIAIAYSGFKPLKDYIGKPDIFNRPFQFEKLSIIDTLAGACTVVMGEGNEQTPMAIITDVPFVEFLDHNPTPQELAEIKIDLDSDLYGPILKKAPWRKGGK